jgi:hypothetical protein
VKVTTDSPGKTDAVDADSIRAAFTSVANLEWAHVPQSSFSGMDGRNDEKVLGTPGGDMGEFIQALHAYAQVAGSELTFDDTLELFEKYLTVMSREKFTYETDERAYMRLVIAAGCRNLHIADMGGMKRKKEALIANLVNPDHIGDPFIKFLASNTTQLNLKTNLIKNALAAYHTVLWTSPSPLAEKLCYLELKGSHKEGALVTIKTPAYCTDQGLAPMVSQQMACPAPVMVYHKEPVKLFRRELVSAMTAGTDIDPRDVLTVYNVMAEGLMEKFWGSFGAGLPSYTVEFGNSSPLLASDAAPKDEE